MSQLGYAIYFVTASIFTWLVMDFLKKKGILKFKPIEFKKKEN